MAQVSIVGPTDGEVIQLGPIQMRILEDGQYDGSSPGDWRDHACPAYGRAAAAPACASTTRAFMWSPARRGSPWGIRRMTLPQGTLVMVPPGAPHTFANPGDQPVVLLNTFTPDLYVQYFRDLREMIANGEQLTAEASAQVMSRYATSPATDFDEQEPE